MARGQQQTAEELEKNEQVARAVSTWDGCDVAALVEDGGDIGPVTRLGDVVGITDFGAAPYVLVEVNLR